MRFSVLDYICHRLFFPMASQLYVTVSRVSSFDSIGFVNYCKL